MNVPYTLTDATITVYVDGDAYAIPRDWHGYPMLKDLLNQPNHDVNAIRNHVGGYNTDLKEQVFTVDAEVSLDDIEVTRRAVYFKGQAVTTSLARRLLDVQAEGLPIDPWLKFMAKVYDNPADYARAELYDWIERSDLPITDDGDFLAFKRVSDRGEGVEPRYVDLHTGEFDNGPGKVVTMERKDVDPNRHNECSRGLHFCSKEYLDSGMTAFRAAHGKATLLLKINPADVVSIPTDYNHSKGRTWRYEVLQVIPDDVGKIVWEDAVVNEPAEGCDWVEFDEETETEMTDDGAVINIIAIHGRSKTRSIWQRARDWFTQ